MLTIRQTCLNTYKKCAYKFFKEWGEVGETGYYEENESVGNKYSNCGIALHEVMEEAGHVLMEKKIPDRNYMLSRMEERFYEVDDAMFEEGEREVWLESLLNQIDWLYDMTCHSTSVIDVEWTFSIDNMFDDMPPFTGTVDRVEGSIEAKDVSLIDYKTGKVYTRNELKENIQACIYSLAFFRHYGFMPKEFVFYFSKHKKIKTIPITKEFIENVGAEIVRIVSEIKAKHFDTNCTSTYFCKNFCEQYSECPRFRRTNKKGWEALND